MPAKKRNGNGNSSGIGSMSAKQLKRKKPINTDKMVEIQPLTKNQEKFFDAYEKLHHMKRSMWFVLSYLQERLDSYQVTMKTSHSYIRFHIRIW
jgi:hypothetical protein